MILTEKTHVNRYCDNIAANSFGHDNYEVT